MANIDIIRRHALDPQRARAIVDDLVSDLSARLALSGSWDGDRFLFRRNGVEGEIAIETDAIRVRARLGMVYAMLKGTIEDEIHRQLDRHFA